MSSSKSHLCGPQTTCNTGILESPNRIRIPATGHWRMQRWGPLGNCPVLKNSLPSDFLDDINGPVLRNMFNKYRQKLIRKIYRILSNLCFFSNNGPIRKSPSGQVFTKRSETEHVIVAKVYTTFKGFCLSNQVYSVALLF